MEIIKKKKGLLPSTTPEKKKKESSREGGRRFMMKTLKCSMVMLKDEGFSDAYESKHSSASENSSRITEVSKENVWQILPLATVTEDILEDKNRERRKLIHLKNLGNLGEKNHLDTN